MEIKEALAQLDTLVDDQWTTDGSPRVETVSELLGRSVTRAEITEAAPLFNRTNTDSLNETQDNSEDENNLNEVDEREDTPYISHEMMLQTSGPVGKNDTEEELRDRLAKMEPILNAMIKARKDLDNTIKQYEQDLDAVKDRLEVVAPNTTNATAISEYIKSQHEQRLARVERRNTVLQGISEKDLKARSPIDEAMARKNVRGSTRPVRQ